MVYEIGNFIHDLRVERGYSQEELSYGICSTGNLSKIENGVRMPNRKTVEAFMQRLGCEESFLQFSSKEEFYQVELCKKIVNKLAKRDFEGLEELVKEFETTISEDDVLNSQYCRFTKTMINHAKGASAETVIRELEEALQMTKPDYIKGGIGGKGLLTYNEIIILMNIAGNYAEKDSQKAIEILYSLKEYMDTHVLDDNERIKKYQAVIYNLSAFLLEEQRYDEVIRLCDLGIKNSKENNRLHLFPYFFLNKGFALLGKGKVEQAKIQLRKGYHILDAMDDENECLRLRRHLKEKWKLDCHL